jgi:uncharacterized membrane protein
LLPNIQDEFQLDKAMNTFLYITIGLFAAFALVDTVYRARAFPNMRYWRMIGILAMIAYFSVATYAPFLWDETLGAYRLFDLTNLPLWDDARCDADLAVSPDAP